MKTVKKHQICEATFMEFSVRLCPQAAPPPCRDIARGERRRPNAVVELEVKRDGKGWTD